MADRADQTYSPPSDYPMDVLAYTAGIRKVLEAYERGQPLDPKQVDHELQRIERAVAHVLGAIAGAPQ